MYAEHADDVEQFFAAHPIPGTERRVKQALESIRVTAGFSSFLRQSKLANDEFWVNLA